MGERKLTEFLVRNGQALLPMMELIEHSRMAIDELIDVTGRGSIEAVLELSAMHRAAPATQGAPLQDRLERNPAGAGVDERAQPRVDKPRLRRKDRGACKEVPVPIYEAPCNKTRPRTSVCSRFC